MEHERRRAPRYPFVAAAEVVEEISNIRLNARVSELSISGCYVDTVNPLPTGTAVTVKVFTETEFIEARALVVYSHENLGMGLTFKDLHKPYYMETLRKWLLGAMRAKNAEEQRTE